MSKGKAGKGPLTVGELRAKLAKLPDDYVVVACVRGYPYAEVHGVKDEGFGDKLALLTLDPAHEAHAVR